MALKPDDGETFLREVDDELRREQMAHFMKRYGWAIVAAVAARAGGDRRLDLVEGARQQRRAEAQGETLIAALDSLEAGNRGAAAPKLAALAGSDVPGYRAAALFARANSQTAAGNAPAAIATLRAIAADQELDEVYRQAALIRQTQLEFDSLPPQQVVQRLRPLARPGSAWLGSAGEMLGVAYLKMHRPDLAGPVFAAVGRDENVPPIDPYKSHSDGGLSRCQRRRRAGRAGRVRAAGPPAPQPAPAATREKAE